MPRYESIRSISRGIAILQAINRSGGLSMSDIARASGVPYPTAFRIVQTLLAEKLIEREPTRKYYRPTALVQTLSNGYHGDGRLVNASRHHIVSLTEKHGWPITIATHIGHRMIICDSTHTLTSLTFNHYYPGYTLPILDCAVGRAFLAYLDEDERHRILETLKIVPNLVNRNALEMFETGELTESIRHEGCAATGYNNFTETPGKTSSIAVPLRDGDTVVGAIALIYFSSAMRMKDAVSRYRADIQDAASAIRNELVGMPEVDPASELAIC